jgi:hypothetical protein
MMRKTTRRKVNIIPQNIEDPTNPRDQNPEIEDIDKGPNNFRLESTKITNRNLILRKNSPEEYEKVLM